MQITDKLNRPLHDLRISVIDRCNFRCSYCMPESRNHTFLNNIEWLCFDEIIRVVKAGITLGVKKVRLTGGEPLLRPDLCELIKELSQIKDIEDLALTTNGALLAQYAKELKKSGLQRLTVSLDSLNSRVFKEMSGQKGSLKDVLDGIETASVAGFQPIKINVVIQKGVNDHTIYDMVKYAKDRGHTLRFIEYMDVGNCNHWQSEYVVASKDIYNLIHHHFPLRPKNPDYFGEVADRYIYEDGSGEVGFISSISQPFCQSCTRLRLTADGKLFTCLFATKGLDIREVLRKEKSDAELKKMIQNIWKKREDRYSELRPAQVPAQHSNPKVEMFQVGG